MSQSRKEFLLGVLLALLLWLFGPDIIPESFEPYIRPVAGTIIVLLSAWIFVGDRVISWYSNTSNERKQRKIKSLNSELIEIQAYQAFFQANPNKFVESIAADVFQVLLDLSLGFFFVFALSIFEIIRPIPLSVIAIPSFWEALKGARKAYRFYKRILSFPNFKEETEANIRRLSSSQQPNIKIIKAFYSVNDTGIKFDVTNNINNKITDNKIDYVVGNDLVLCDPAPGLEKKLSLRYLVNRQEKNITMGVGERLLIP